MILRLLVLGFTALVVLTTMWLLNVFGLLATLLHIDAPWAASPLPFF